MTPCPPNKTRPFGGWLTALFLASCVILILAGHQYYSGRQADARTAAQQELSAIADLKLNQIMGWREERLSDARFFSRARFVADDLQRFLRAPGSDDTRSSLTNWLHLLKGGDRYRAVLLFDAQLERRLAIPESATAPAELVRGLLEESLRDGGLALTDLRLDPASGLISLDLLFPIFANADPRQGGPIGAVLLELDPRRFLFPLVQSWPTPSRTAETLLVRQEGDEVLFLNEARHRPGAALALRLPLASSNVFAARILRGKTGAIEALDYRGVPVVAIGRKVPGTPWTMIAKMDQEEVYATVRKQARATVPVLDMLVVAGALLAALLWHYRSARFLKRELALRNQADEQIRVQVAALQSAANAVVITGSDGLIQWVNPAFTNLTGYTAAEAIGRKANLLKSGRHPPAFYRSLWDTILAGRVWHGEVVNCRKDGTHYSEEMTITPVTTAAGGIEHFVAIKQDVTGRKQAEVALRESEQRLRLSSRENADLRAALNEHAIVAITDARGRITYVNDKFCAISRYSREELIGQDHRIVNSGHHPKEFIRDLWTTIARGGVWQGDIKNRAKDGSFYWVATTIMPFLDDQGKPVQYIAIRADITERKRAEDEIRQLNEDLENRVTARTAQLEAANKELEAFSYSVSHDLRAPLRHIDGFVGLLRKSAGASLPEPGRHYLDTIADSARQMGRLIDDLLVFSRMGRTEMHQARVNLEQMLEDTLRALGPETEGRNIVWKKGRLPEVEADPTLLPQVLVNLLSNAIKYTRPRDPAEIEIGCAKANGKEDVIFVRDNGVGFDMAYADKLFGVFQRLHFDEEFEGTGIGLANVRRIVARHGGRTWAEGKVNDGATFYFSLPKNDGGSHP